MTCFDVRIFYLIELFPGTGTIFIHLFIELIKYKLLEC